MKARKASSREPQYYVDRIKTALADPNKRVTLREQMRFIHSGDMGHEKYIMNRDYGHYNSFFSQGLAQFFGVRDMEITQAIKSLFRDRKVVNILEDGPGKAIFLTQLRKELRRIGMNCHTTGLNYGKIRAAVKRKKMGAIDELVHGKPAELYVPDKKFEAIFSLFGSIHYTHYLFQKDHLLKFANALSRGGILIAGIDIRPKVTYKPWNKQGLLSTAERNAKIPLELQMKNIERAFEKRGFRAKFYFSEGGENLPNWMLIVQRLK